MSDTADLQSQLSSGAGAAARADASRGKIAEAAAARLDDVRGRLNELRGRAVTDAAAGEEYEALTVESGRLEMVLARGNVPG